MTMLKLSVLNQDNQVLYSQESEDEVTLAYRGTYNEGDKVRLESNQKNIYIKIRLDDSLMESIVFLKDYQYEFIIPFYDQKKPYGNKTFIEERHWGYVSLVSHQELKNYTNLALNTFDTNINNCIFPHATTNVSTDNPQFYSRNVIDGIFETSLHGSWPHSSWGINKQSDAWLKIDFGKEVTCDCIVIYLRADFPHDNYWEYGEIELSNGKTLYINLIKSGKRQEFPIEAQKIKWIRLKNLRMSEAESLFPALSQIMVWGYRC